MSPESVSPESKEGVPGIQGPRNPHARNPHVFLTNGALSRIRIVSGRAISKPKLYGFLFQCLNRWKLKAESVKAMEQKYLAHYYVITSVTNNLFIFDSNNGSYKYSIKHRTLTFVSVIDKINVSTSWPPITLNLYVSLSIN